MYYVLSATDGIAKNDRYNIEINLRKNGLMIKKGILICMLK
jgi:hypothetical protein